MKVRATFRSKTSFAWCSEIGTDVKSKAYQCFLAREGEDENDKLEDANLLNFEKNMFYYTYPSNPLPDYLLNFYQQHFEKSEKNMMDKKICEDWKEKIEEWAVSFDSIFMLYLNNQCNYFYCFFKEFALLCLSPRSTLCNEFQMIMNCSSKKLRETLITKGIPFVMPLFKKQQVATSLEKNQNEGQELQELQEISKKAPGQANFTTRESKLDFQEETTLLFEGKETLLKMVKFFKEYVLKKSSEMPNSQIPVIYSRAPFLNSSLKNIKIETSQILTSNDQSSVQEILHTLALEGPLFPEVVINLCNLFCTTQSEFTVTFIKKKQPGTPYHDTLIFNNSLSLSHTPPTIKTLTFQEGQYKYQPFT
uniref:Uncharacterized protein n=1 Tax=Arcella intermedia TaxID=1963864 RepID=A0A6B2L7X7_9EUKA